jgi:hypothetical protein
MTGRPRGRNCSVSAIERLSNNIGTSSATRFHPPAMKSLEIIILLLLSIIFKNFSAAEMLLRHTHLPGSFDLAALFFGVLFYGSRRPWQDSSHKYNNLK